MAGADFQSLGGSFLLIEVITTKNWNKGRLKKVAYASSGGAGGVHQEGASGHVTLASTGTLVKFFVVIRSIRRKYPPKVRKSACNTLKIQSYQGFSRNGQNPKSAHQRNFCNVANLSICNPKRRLQLAGGLSLRLIDEDASNEELAAEGYYRGFPCPLGHTIRDSTHHWCYKCILKIKSNFCGFDLNYILSTYQPKAKQIWNAIQVGDQKDCWEYHWDGPCLYQNRITFPSYRSGIKNRTTDRVSLSKAVYTLAWGDIGTMSVTRTCKNTKCLNPLHLTSSWNDRSAPRTLTCLVNEYDYRKVLLAARTLRLNKDLEFLLSITYSNTIEDPRLKKVEEK